MTAHLLPEIVRLKGEGLSFSQIGRRLGVTRSAVQGQWSRELERRAKVAPNKRPAAVVASHAAMVGESRPDAGLRRWSWQGEPTTNPFSIGRPA